MGRQIATGSTQGAQQSLCDEMRVDLERAIGDGRLERLHLRRAHLRVSLGRHLARLRGDADFGGFRRGTFRLRRRLRRGSVGGGVHRGEGDPPTGFEGRVSGDTFHRVLQAAISVMAMVLSNLHPEENGTPPPDLSVNFWTDESGATVVRDAFLRCANYLPIFAGVAPRVRASRTRWARPMPPPWLAESARAPTIMPP